MEIKELKKLITENNLNIGTQLWVMADYSSWVIAKQYLNYLSDNKNLILKYIDSTDEIPTDSLFEDNNLYVYKVNELKESLNFNNLIVICDKVKTSKDKAVFFPKLENWQFIDYASVLVPGVKKEDLEWLLTQYEYTYDRVTEFRYLRYLNDIKKISIFKTSEQQEVFNDLYNSGEYSDLSNLTIFDLSSAILKKDKKLALEVLKVFPYIDSKPDVWLLSILLNNFKKLLDIQLNPLITASEMGISDKQFYVIKKNYLRVYSNQELIDIYEMLTRGEYLYKFGGLPTDHLVEYLVCKILGG